MNISAPIYQLKSRAKAIRKRRGIKLSQALDEVATQEGFANWSLLVSKQGDLLPNNFNEVLDYLNPADLVLVAARPRMGKTVFVSGLLAQACEEERHTSFLFTLVDTEQDARSRVEECFDQPGVNFRVDCSNEISARYIIDQVSSEIGRGSLIIVDYLQLLDEKRTLPPVQEQVAVLKAFARSSGCIVIFLCQIDRQVAARQDPEPKVTDIRLPNPLDMDLFNKVFLLHRPQAAKPAVTVKLAGNAGHQFDVLLDADRLRFRDTVADA